MRNRNRAICRIALRWARPARALATGQEGGALVELAMALPIMLALLTAIVSFGMAFSNQLTLTQGLGTSAQFLQQIRTTTTDPCADTMNALSQAAPTLKKTNIILMITMNGTTVSGSSCSGSQSNLIQGQPVTVAATYPCSLMVYGVTLSSTCRLGAQVTEYEY